MSIRFLKSRLVLMSRHLAPLFRPHEQPRTVRGCIFFMLIVSTQVLNMKTKISRDPPLHTRSPAGCRSRRRKKGSALCGRRNKGAGSGIFFTRLVVIEHICLMFSIDVCITRSEMLLIDHVLCMLLCAPICPQTAEEKRKQVYLLVVIGAREIQ